MGEKIRRVHLKNMITIQLKKQLEEKGLPTTGTKADQYLLGVVSVLGVEQAIRKIDGNLDELFITVEETPTAKKIQVSDMFNKTMAVIQAVSEQNTVIQTQLQVQSEPVSYTHLDVYKRQIPY